MEFEVSCRSEKLKLDAAECKVVPIPCHNDKLKLIGQKRRVVCATTLRRICAKPEETIKNLNLSAQLNDPWMTAKYVRRNIEVGPTNRVELV
ncbi:MAG: hypothetical protein C5B55_14345 [Blastocatellia bacterium]|nr:MAG: hypothetical protein C5B55_14345 [Blastocatellia bacterium]